MVVLCFLVLLYWGGQHQNQPQDAFIQECDVLKSDLLQNDLDVEGQYVTEQYMIDELKWTECFVRKKLKGFPIKIDV